MILIGILTLGACAGLVAGVYLLRREQRGRVASLILDVEREAGLAGPGGLTAPAGRRLFAGLHRYLPAAMMAAYDERLGQAGRPYGLDAQQLVTVKVVAAGLVPALISVFALLNLNAITLMLLPLAGLVGFVAPDVWLTLRLAERQQKVAEELPLFTDLVATAVGAGLPITEAVRRVAADAPGLVAREFLRAVQEMAAGKQRLQAWRDLMDRLPGDDLRTIVTAVMQAEQYGTSVAEMLKYQVQQIRLFKQQNAQRTAQSVAVKMRIPMHVL
ncbi:MAG TPA: type II secretion system F family protein [Symbiobacteriaceae bacterium]